MAVRERIPHAAFNQTGFSPALVEAFSDRLDEPDWMRQRRREAWARYQQMAMPSWRRMPLDNLNLESFRLSVGPDDGQLTPELSAIVEAEEERAGLLIHRNAGVAYKHLKPDLAARGVILSDLHTAVRDHPHLVRRHFMTVVPVAEGKLEALHGALWSGGLFLYVPRNVNIELPIRATFWMDQPGLAIFPHVLIVAEEGSSLTYIEDHRSPTLGEDWSMAVGVVEIHLEPGAQVRYVTLQDWGQDVFSFSTYRALCQRDSFINWTLGATGGGISRTFVESRLAGDGSSTEIIGVHLIGEEQHLEVNSVMNHIGRFTAGDLLFKGVLKDQARSVFEGLIKIHPGAQDTNSYLSDQTLLLSNQARADSIPSLEIEANEVRASHGATVSQIDEDHVFYLMTRGLTRSQAIRMIVDGFFQPVMDRIPLESVAEKLRAAIDRKMSDGHAVHDYPSTGQR